MSLYLQINELASFIMNEVPGEPSQSQGAVDTAIRIIRELQAENSELKEKAWKYDELNK